MGQFAGNRCGDVVHNMRKVHIREFDSKRKKWMCWRQDFETCMKGAKIDPKWWVAVLPMYLNDPVRDAYEEYTGAGRGNSIFRGQS